MWAYLEIIGPALFNVAYAQLTGQDKAFRDILSHA